MGVAGWMFITASSTNATQPVSYESFLARCCSAYIRYVVMSDSPTAHVGLSFYLGLMHLGESVLVAVKVQQ
jgi:hypothetical protein